MPALPWREPPLTREQEDELFVLFLEDDVLQAQTADGRLLLTPEQEAEARVAESEARRRAEAEIMRLRAELGRLK